MPVIGDIIARMKADDTSFKRGVESASKWSKEKFAGIGSAASGAFAGAFASQALTGVIQKGAELKTFALQAGITAEEFQRLNFAIEAANGDASDTVSIMLDLKRAMADARSGNKQWVADFKSLGISLDTIKKDDPVRLFKELGRVVANTAELTGEQVNALGRMMGEDTSARAIAAFRNSFESTLESVNVMSDQTIEKLRAINVELKKISMESDKNLADQLADKGAGISMGAKVFGKLKNDLILGSGALFGLVNDQVFKPMVKDFLEPAVNAAYELKYGNMNNLSVRDASPEFKRREEIQSQFQKAQLEVLKQIRDKTGSGASIDASVMGGL